MLTVHKLHLFDFPPRVRTGLHRLGQSGWSIVPIIGVAMSGWFLLTALLV